MRPIPAWNGSGSRYILQEVDPSTGEVMASSLQVVEAAALELSSEERAQLAQRLLSSLARDPEVEAAWDAEIRRRVAELESGAMDTIPAEEVFAEARRQLNA